MNEEFFPIPPIVGGIRRILYVTDRNGVEHPIRTPQDLQDILNQMTPDELALWQARYRFAPVTNCTGNTNYTGTIKDLK